MREKCETCARRVVCCVGEMNPSREVEVGKFAFEMQNTAIHLVSLGTRFFLESSWPFTLRTTSLTTARVVRQHTCAGLSLRRPSWYTQIVPPATAHYTYQHHHGGLLEVEPEVHPLIAQRCRPNPES